MKKTLLDLKNEKNIDKKIETWIIKSEDINLECVKNKPIDINGEEWNYQIKNLSEINLDFPRIKEIIEILSFQ